MKNTLLSTLLVMGLFLMPGYGLNFMNGSSVDWRHATTAEQSDKTAAVSTPTNIAPVADTETSTKTQSTPLRPLYSSHHTAN